MARAPVFAWQDALLSLDLRDAPMRRSTVIGVGFVLAFHFNRDLVAWPSVQKLSQESGHNPGTVRRVSALLEELSLLRVDRRGRGAGASNTNRYHGLLPEDGNGSPGVHSTPFETDLRRPVFLGGNGSAGAAKRVPADPKTGPSGTPNSNEQQKNSAGVESQSLVDLKREYPDQWAKARSEVGNVDAAGRIIQNPEAFAVPRFKELVNDRHEKRKAIADEAEAMTTIANCERCDETGWYWEDQEPPYGPRGIKCGHG
jgi:hypothetical protein